MSHFLKQEKIKDKNHLKFICNLQCCITGAKEGLNAHHLLRDDMGRIKRGMGMKAGDDFTIPLHFAKHQELHADGNEPRYLEEEGIYRPVELALILYAFTGQEEFCNRVLETWRKT